MSQERQVNRSAGLTNGAMFASRAAYEVGKHGDSDNRGRTPPSGARGTKGASGLAFLLARRRVVAALGRRHGNVFTLELPGFGRTVVVGDPDQIQDLFGTSRELLCRSKLNLGRIFGPGSMFNLSGDEHLKRRRLLSSPFHSVHVAKYRDIVQEEFLRESATWPEGREFETMPAMTRITLRGLLRVVVGAEGAVVDELSALLPPAVALGARIGLSRRSFGGISVLEPRCAPAAESPQFDAVIYSLIAETRGAPNLENRGDALAILMRSRTAAGADVGFTYRRRIAERADCRL